ncbi:Phosphatidylinositol N-acetylglucosaminyltransferase subunit Q [Glycine soja]|uniref:Phosphatidylinositol N-acetylglucosaminyltransferase subunit Q n=1 Tax=Glycine soja TaxID=3848 RepID=A0A0B2Q541_GLYSO|nr:Phosphatidylinositol N-acetylglucosaminyltransferase subunit Q [Glycine soja]
MRRHCRLWWPKQLLSNKESSSSILLGWFVTCSPSSLDIIVAFTCSEVLLSSYSPGIQRQWLDSFDYTVKQQIVGSLLFTPLLLLLPTTSFFYIFFSIVDTTINLVCPLIEVTTISVIHVTPYTKIFLWLVRPGRFPSGIWLEIIGCQSNSTASPSADFTDEITSYKESLHLKDFNREKSSSLVSALHSNYLSIVSGSSISTVAHGILIGQRCDILVLSALMVFII